MTRSRFSLEHRPTRRPAGRLPATRHRLDSEHDTLRPMRANLRPCRRTEGRRHAHQARQRPRSVSALASAPGSGSVSSGTDRQSQAPTLFSLVETEGRHGRESGTPASVRVAVAATKAERMNEGGSVSRSKKRERKRLCCCRYCCCQSRRVSKCCTGRPTDRPGFGACVSVQSDGPRCILFVGVMPPVRLVSCNQS